MSRAAPIYLDHHATTPVDPRVLEAMLPYFREHFGNPSSATHAYGWAAEAAVEDARERIARCLGASRPEEIVFTSGATEANNLALQGGARARRGKRRHLVASAIEHPSVLEPLRALAREGFELTELPVSGEGLVDPATLAAALGPQTALVSIGAANGEIGVLQPVDALAALCRERDVWFHCDAAQAAGKVPLPVAELGLDLVSVSAHKVYGPKGIGALYVRGGRPRVRPEPLLLGGGQERGLRSGTLAVPLIVGFARALELAEEERQAEARRLAELRDHLLRRLERELGGVHRNGPPARRLPGNLNLAIEGIEAGALLASLRDVALSSGSACASAKPEPSPVLKALGLPDDLVRASVRFGLGRSNTREQIDRAADRVIQEVRALRDGSGAARQRQPRAAPLGPQGRTG